MRLPPLSDTRRGNGAMILSLLIVMAIILYLYFGSTGSSSGGGSTSKPGSGSGGSSYMGQVQQTRKKGREEANQITTQQLTTLIVIYRDANNGKLPKTPADMEDQAAFKDQWGNEMTFSFEKSREKTTVKYHSNGPDGEAGTEDDVVRTDVLPF